MGNRLKTIYPDGQLVMDLRGQSESPIDPIAVLTEFLVYGFGVEPQHLATDLAGLQRQFNDRLSGQRILVILDNAKDGLQVEPLVPRVEGCGMIVTSREKLANVSGVTAQNIVPIEVMPLEEAIELLDQLCGDKTIDRTLTEKLATLCGRLPLALTIVGRLLNQTTSLTLVKLVADLEQERSRLRVLKYRDARDQIDPTLDVEASFNLSYAQLLPEQQRVFGVLSVLRGVDFGLELAAVLGEMETEQVQRRLDQLVTLALVQMPEGKVDRYCFHDLMREFGRGKLTEERGLAMKALEWYYEQAALDLESGIEKFLVEQENWVPIVIWAQELEQHQTAVWLAVNLAKFFDLKSLWSNWVATHQVALKSADAIGDSHGIAATMNNLGLVYKNQGKWEEAIDCFQQSWETRHAIGDSHGIAQTMNNLGLVYQSQGKWEEAIDCYRQSLETYGAIGDSHGIAQTMNNLGLVYHLQGKWEEAIECYRQSLETKRAIGNHHGVATTIMNIGNVYHLQGKWEEAIDCFQQSLETKRAIGDQHGIAQTMNNLGLVYKDQGKWEEAIDCFQQSLETKRAIGDTQGIAQTIGNLGNVYKDQEKWEEAIDCSQQSLESFRAIGDTQGIAQTIGNLGAVYQSQGKWEEAIDCFQQSIQGSHAIGDPQTEANGWYNLGNTQAKLGNPTARTSYQNAKALYQQLKLTNDVEMCDDAISSIGQSVRSDTLARAPKIGDDRAPRKKKRSFPLWQSAIVLLLLGIGWMAMKPQAPASQNGEVRMQK
jgi:tetratricopeptide (TPR) repeat protein